MAEAAYKTVVQHNVHQIVSMLHLNDGVLEYLIKFGAITGRQHDEVVDVWMKNDKTKSNELLLNILMGQNERKCAIAKFIQALESTGQVKLAGILKSSSGPGETLSEIDKKSIQSHCSDLVTKMNTTKIVDILKEDESYFSAYELQDIASKLTDKEKANFLISEVINKGTYRHLHELKKALIQIGQNDLASYLPVTIQTDVYGTELKDGILIILIQLICNSDVEPMRSELITKFTDPAHDLYKKMCHMYSLKNITAETSTSCKNLIKIYLKLHAGSAHKQIKEHMRNGHLENVIKQNSYLTTKAGWHLVFQLECDGDDDMGNGDDDDERSFHMTHQEDTYEVPLLAPPEFASLQFSSVNSATTLTDSRYSSSGPSTNLKLTSGTNLSGYMGDVTDSGFSSSDPSTDVQLKSGGCLSNENKTELIAHASFLPSSTSSRNPSYLKEQVFYSIQEKDSTPFDFGQAISDCKQANILSTDIKTLDGLNILHTCIDKGRLSYLPMLVSVGWWNIQSKEKVPEDSPNEHRGKTAKQIAESKRAKKPLTEFNSANEWDSSLSPLMKACRSGDISRAMQLMQVSGEELFYCDYNGGNALFWAVIHGDVKLIDELIKMGVDPTVRTKKKENLLHIACMVGNSNVIETLLTKSLNIDPWLHDNSSKTPLDRTAENGDIPTLVKFVKKGYRPKSNSTALCAFVGRKPYLSYLLDDLKMDVDSLDIYSRTALHRACEGNKIDIVRMLRSKNATISRVTCTGRSLFHILAENGSIHLMMMMLKLFQEKGILDEYISAQDRYNGVELCFLIRGRDKGRDAWHYVEVKRYLVPVFLVKTKSGNVDVAHYGDVINSGWGVNPSQDVIEEIEQMFKDRRLNQLAAADMTPLHIALFKGNVEVAKVLIENGANVNTKDSFGNTPLMIAASKGNLELVRVLERKGANFNDVNTDGKGISDIADENQHEDVVNYVKGRDFREVTKNFCQGKISTFENQLSQSHLDRVRRSGGDVKRDIIDTLRNFRIDINEFLVDIGSGPVLEASDNDGPGFPKTSMQSQTN